MANAYFGIIAFVFFIFGCLRKLNKHEILLLSLSILFLIISFGSATPIRELLYHYLPGFNLFRFHSLFRLFFIITTLLFVGTTIQYIQENKKWNVIRIISLLLVTISLIVLIINKNEITFINNLEIFSFSQHIYFQLIIHCLLLTCLILLRKFNIIFLIVLISIDLLLSIQLNSHASMVLDVKSKDVDKLIENRDQQIEMPSTSPLNTHIDQAYQYRWPLNWNMNCYFGEIAIDGYNPFVLKTFNELSDSKLKDSIWNKAFFYLDNNENAKVELIYFKPNEFHFKVNTIDSNILTLAQNPYPGWHVYINGSESQAFTNNISQQSVKISNTDSIVIWKFSNQVINVIFVLHLLILLTLFVYYFRLYYQFVNLQKIK